jgi:WD40 repeat protein
VAFSPDGKLLASGGGDNAAAIYVWDLEQRKPIHQLNDRDDTFLKGVAFSPDGKTLATTGAVKTVKLWELPGGKLLHTLKADRLGWDDGYHVKETAVAWHPNGKAVASPSKYPTLLIWDAAKGQELRTLSDADQVPSGVSWSPDGSVLAAVGHDHLTLRDGNTGASRGTIPVGGMAVAWAPDSRHVVVARKDGMGRGTAALGDVAVVVLRLRELKDPAPPK